MTDLVAKINSLTVFGNLKRGAVLSALKRICEEETVEKKVEAYSDFVAAVYEGGGDFAEIILREACEDINVYSRLRAKKARVSATLKEAVRGETEILQELCELGQDGIRALTGYSGFLPPFDNTVKCIAAEYEKRMKSIRRTGYGMFASNIMFRPNGRGGLEPVNSPDVRGIDRLVGYEEERQLLIDNTLALAEGRPAANAFLYGDAGTGKSSTVKAVANMLAPKGIRLVEVRKDGLGELSKIMELLRDNPLKFIIFIDDISFNSVDADFGILKNMLEGSTAVKPENAVIYATSNRRHFVKESFSDRDGDDVHRNDTLQEVSALSARFGLSILFRSPDKKLYLRIAEKLVRDRNVKMDREELERRATAFALRKGGFSPRCAEQFADSLLIKTED